MYGGGINGFTSTADTLPLIQGVKRGEGSVTYWYNSRKIFSFFATGDTLELGDLKDVKFVRIGDKLFQVNRNIELQRVYNIADFIDVDIHVHNDEDDDTHHLWGKWNAGPVTPSNKKKLTKSKP